MELTCYTDAKKIKSRWATKDNKDRMKVKFGNEFVLDMDKEQARALHKELDNKIEWR